MKKREFYKLQQGNISVSEYLNRFTRLSRYALEDVANEGAKIWYFMEGLDLNIKVQLVSNDHPNFQQMVNKALMQEDAQR